FPKMAVLKVSIQYDHLKIADITGDSEKETLRIWFHEFENQKKSKVQVWQSVCDAVVMPERVNEWFSDVLETKCQMVYMPDESEREINEKFRQNSEIVSFADGYPFLVLGENS